MDHATVSLLDAKNRVLRPTTLRNVRYLGSAVRTFRNWPTFVADYVTASNASRVYALRSGVEFETHEAVDATTIGVVFLRREYGSIGRDWTVIDVGANIGVFAVFAAEVGVRVFAYEPMPENYELLLRNLERNHLLEQVRAFPFGVAARRERRALFVADNNASHTLFPPASGGRNVSVECVSLADVFEDNAISRCDLLKLDCEGAEFEILAAAPAATLRRIRRVRLEWHPGYDLEELIGLLATSGFRVVWREAADEGRGMLWLERDDAPQAA